MKQVIVAGDFLNEALYIDGILQLEDDTIYACDIARLLKGSPFTLEHKMVDLVSEKFPDLAIDLVEVDINETMSSDGVTDDT